MKKYIKWIIGILVLTLVVIVGLRVKNNSSVTLVESVDIDEVVVKKSVSASGVVKSYNQANLAFPTLGVVDEILVEEGQEVNRGQVIAYIDNEDTEQAAQASKKALDAAQKDLEIYIENYSTNFNAVGGEDEYNLNVKKLRDLVQRAEANYNSSLATHSKSVLYAPFDGTILDIFKEENEVTAIGETIVKIANLDEEYFEILVDQEDFGLVEEGQEVKISLDSYEEQEFTAHVSDFTKYIDETTSDFVVSIDFDDLDKQKVLVGMKGDANIIVEQTSGPVKALIFDEVFSSNGESYVWVVENGNLAKLPIKVGLEGDIYTEVKTDLTDKEIVIPVQTSDIEEGSKAKVIK